MPSWSVVDGTIDGGLNMGGEIRARIGVGVQGGVNVEVGPTKCSAGCGGRHRVGHEAMSIASAQYTRRHSDRRDTSGVLSRRMLFGGAA